MYRGPLHVSLVATPDAQVSPLSGLFETLGAFGLLAHVEPGMPTKPFDVEIGAPDERPVRGASGIEEKSLGRFNERGLEIKMMKMQAGASFDLKASERPLVVCAMSGEGYANGEPYGALSAFRVKRGESAGLKADLETEFFIVGLPTFD